MSRKPILSVSIMALGLGLSAPALAQGMPDCGEGAGVPCQLPDGQKITPPLARALPACPAEGEEAVELARYICATDDDVLSDWEALTDPAAAPYMAELDTLLGDGPKAAEAAPEAAEAAPEAAEAAPEAAEAAPEAAEAAPEAVEAAPEAAEAASETAEAAPEAVEAEPETAEAAPEAAETAPETAEAAPEAAEAAPEAAETAPETAEVAPETAEGTDEASSQDPAEAPAQSAEEVAAQVMQELENRQKKILERLNAEAEAEAETAASSAAATASDDSAAGAEVEVAEETVTEGEARSSSEEFETSVTAAAPSGDDSGLSAFEKALLVGLGAIAVGQMLDNGDEIVANSGDRVVVRRDGELFVLKNDDALLRQPGSDVRTERFSDGSTREIVTREDGVQIVTVRAADGRVLRRGRILADGTRVLLFDDTQAAEPVRLEDLPQEEVASISVRNQDEEALRRALEAALADDLGRRFSLRQIRDIREVRELAPEIEVDAITFDTGSAAIRPEQARDLADLGRAIRSLIEERPGEVFLVEGHTDAVGAAEYNLALSDRRAETLALALTEYFQVPPENLVVQGYGEVALKVPTLEAERANRRAVVRRITPLLRSDFASSF